MEIFHLIFIIAAVKGIKHKCEYLNGMNFTSLQRFYLCSVSQIEFDENSTHITEISGEHIPEMSNEDVRAVWYSGLEPQICIEYNLTIIPRGFLHFFPNVFGLYFNNCRIDSIVHDDLAEYENLESFMLENSNVEEIPGDLFSSNPNLLFISLARNRIYYVGRVKYFIEV